MPAETHVAFVHGVALGTGGLAVQSANALAALATRAEVHAYGPGVDLWPRTGPPPPVLWHPVPSSMPWWFAFRLLRGRSGAAQQSHDMRLARSAAERLSDAKPDLVYGFTHVSLDALRWARDRGIQTVLESPNGHIRAFRRIYTTEHERWCGGRYPGPPAPMAVDRIEQEYAIADRIRVSSSWVKRSLVDGGVPAPKIHVLQQPVDLERYRPPVHRPQPSGPLRVLFVGSLDLRKGFVYLLRAVRALGAAASVEIVGNTVDRCTRRVFERERSGLPVTASPGDPLPAYHRAEVAVLPSLEDGSPFAAAEAMACGLPLITTDACGAAEWVEQGRTGWIVPARDGNALADALREAARRRQDLAAMGGAARAATERRADPSRCDRALADWALAETPTAGR